MFTLEEKKASPLCVLCTLMPQLIPLLTLMLTSTYVAHGVDSSLEI